jgi:asparagine N-glycosylation enzyme membrane subunit Stt3
MRRGTLGTACTLAAICVVGFLLRTTNAATVLLGDHVVLAENDPYYHLRRIFAVLAGYPRVPSFDPWIDFPHGAPIVFAPLFDFAIATLALLAGLTPDQRVAVETLALFVPPVLGALTSVAVYLLARRVTSRGAALLAALLLALTPAHGWYSRLGFVDHHVAVTLVAVLLCALALMALGVRAHTEASAAAPNTPESLRLFPALAAALALGCGVLLWNGTLLLVAVMDAALLALFIAGDDARRIAVASLIALTHVVAALMVLAVVPSIVHDTGWPWGAVTVSYLHVVLLVLGGGLAAATAVLVRRGASGRTLLVVAAASGTVVVFALVLQRDALARVHDWLFAADPFMGAVQESVSILRTSDGFFDLTECRVWMGRFFLATPFLLGFLGWQIARGGWRDAGRLFLLVWAAEMFAAALAQRRFAETAAPALSILVADFLVQVATTLHARLAAHGVSRAALRVALGSALAFVVAFAFAPYYVGFFEEPGRLTALLRAPLGPGAASAWTDADRAEQEGSVEVRLDRTLRRLGALEAARLAESGRPGPAMSAWPLGHKLLHVANTPVTVTPFGSYVGGEGFADSTDFLLTADDGRVRDILERRGIRWVVVDNDLGTIGAAIVGRGDNPRRWYLREMLADGDIAYVFQLPLLHSTYFRLTSLVGSEATVTVPDGPSEMVPAIRGLRLVIDAARDDAIGFVKVYEVVPGMRLRVRTSPGARVVARYAWRSDVGRQRTYVQSAVADPSGDASLSLPYSSERPDLGHTSPWRIGVGESTRELTIAEADVRAGREQTITLP